MRNTKNPKTTQEEERVEGAADRPNNKERGCLILFRQPLFFHRKYIYSSSHNIMVF